MRNTGNQLIAAARALLRETILPELRSDLARARLRQVMATLRDVNWDEAPLTLLRENAALQDMVRGGPEATGCAPTAVPATFVDAWQENIELRRQLGQRFAANTQGSWNEGQAQAARVLADCARMRVLKPPAEG